MVGKGRREDGGWEEGIREEWDHAYGGGGGKNGDVPIIIILYFNELVALVMPCNSIQSHTQNQSQCGLLSIVLVLFGSNE